MYARPPQHAQQHVGHPHAVYQQSSPYVSAAAATAPSHYVQPHEAAMVAGPASVANSHPQLPQLHAYPHLQLQYTYPSPLQTSHQPPTPQTHHVYAQPTSHVQHAQIQQQQQPQQVYRVVPASQQQHAQLYAQAGHLQPHAQSYRPGAAGAPGHTPRAPSPLSHQVQTAPNGQQLQYVQQAQHIPQAQVAGQTRPPTVQARSTARHPSQPPQAQPMQLQTQAAQPSSQRPSQPPIARQSSYNTRTRTASAQATSVAVNGALPSASTESSMPPPSRGPTPAVPSPAGDVIDAEQARTSRVNSQSVNGATTSPEPVTTGTEMTDAAGRGAGEATAPVVEAVVVQPPPTFPYYGKEVVPAYLPGQEPLGIGLQYGLPGVYGGYGVSMGGGYFEDVKGGMNGWLDHQGHNTDPLLQPGAAVDALSFFRESMSGMAGGTMDEWNEFVEDHFDDGARLQITLASALSGLKLYDLPSTSLARFFSSFPPSLVSTSFHLHHQTEHPLWSPPQSPSTEMPYNALPRHGVRVDSDGEWRWVYAPSPASGAAAVPTLTPVRGRETKEVVWKIRLQATFVPVLDEGVLKMENLEVMVDEWYTTVARAYGHEQADVALAGVSACGVVGEWGLPGKLLRILDILEGMEEMLGVVEVAQGMAPRNALRDMTLVPSPKKERPSPAKSPAVVVATGAVDVAVAPVKRSPVKYHSPLKVLSEVKVLSPIMASPEKESESVGDVIEVDMSRDVEMA